MQNRIFMGFSRCFVHAFVHRHVKKEKTKESLMWFSSNAGVQILFIIRYKNKFLKLQRHPKSKDRGMGLDM